MNHKKIFSTESDKYVELARKTIESYIKDGITIKLPKDLPSEMTDKRAGAFVSLHKNGELRGCIGTILATTDCVGEEIIQNADKILINLWYLGNEQYISPAMNAYFFNLLIYCVDNRAISVLICKIYHSMKISNIFNITIDGHLIPPSVINHDKSTTVITFYRKLLALIGKINPR